jgi:hypothetical protein
LFLFKSVFFFGVVVCYTLPRDHAPPPPPTLREIENEVKVYGSVCVSADESWRGKGVIEV